MESENKFALACLRTINENIMAGRKPIYNPVCMLGLSKEKRFELIDSVFHEDFNKLYTSRYVSCCEIKTEKDFDFNKDLVIIENIELLVGNSLLQDKVCNIINECLENDVQIILCSNENIDDLELEKSVKCRLKWGLSLHLK